MGEAYVIFGGADLPPLIDTLAAEQDFGLLPAEGFSHLGLAFAAADVNGDGIDDLIAGAPYAGREPGTGPGGPRTTVGEVYIVYGARNLGGQVSVSRQEEDVLLAGLNLSDQFGATLAAADVNGDGTPDIIAGASGYDGAQGDRTEAGAAFVFFGGDLPRRATLLEADLFLHGARPGESAASALAAVDADGNGAAEVALSAPFASGADGTRNASGEATVVDLANVLGGSIDLNAAGAARRVFGAIPQALMPSALAAGNAGVRPLLALGSPLTPFDGRPAAGIVYVVELPLAGDVDLAESAAAAVTVTGASAGDALGSALAFADLDGDGSAELLIQAPAGPENEGHLYAIALD
jgi:hypothetical protein